MAESCGFNPMLHAVQRPTKPELASIQVTLVGSHVVQHSEGSVNTHSWFSLYERRTLLKTDLFYISDERCLTPYFPDHNVSSPGLFLQICLQTSFDYELQRRSYHRPRDVTSPRRSFRCGKCPSITR